MNTRLFLVTIVSLLAAPVLAGCAENGDNGTTPTPTGGSPTPTTTTSPTPTATPTVIPSPPADLGLDAKIGIMVPLTGALSNLGPDMRDGALLAVEEIEAAGLGIDIETFIEDDKTTDTSAAPSTFNRLVGQGVTAVIGPCCSGVTGAILDLAVQNEVVVASMSATSPALTLQRENDGYFWRIVPSDAVQGKVLAQLVNDDGVASVNMIIVNNAYGTGLAQVFQDTYEGLGGTVNVVERYNEGAQEFSSAVTSVCGAQAEGLVFVAYIADGANILKEMQRQGCLGNFQMYSAEGMFSGEGREGLPEEAGQDSQGNWLAAGIKGTTPQAAAASGFADRFKAKYGRDPNQYAAESYDAVYYVVLGMISANAAEASEWRNNLQEIANSGAGKVETSDFKQAAALAAAGTGVNWVGQAHNFDFDENHEPATGVYQIWEVGEDGNVAIIASDRTA